MIKYQLTEHKGKVLLHFSNLVCSKAWLGLLDALPNQNVQRGILIWLGLKNVDTIQASNSSAGDPAV